MVIDRFDTHTFLENFRLRSVAEDLEVFGGTPFSDRHFRIALVRFVDDPFIHLASKVKTISSNSPNLSSTFDKRAS